jgi:hypothetical protein
LAEVAAHGLVRHADGSPLDYTTPWRWIVRGVRMPGGKRLHLEAVPDGGIGRKAVVRESALKAFLAAAREGRRRLLTGAS